MLSRRFLGVILVSISLCGCNGGGNSHSSAVKAPPIATTTQPSNTSETGDSAAQLAQQTSQYAQHVGAMLAHDGTRSTTLPSVVQFVQPGPAEEVPNAAASVA